MEKIGLSNFAILVGLTAFFVYWFAVYGGNEVFHTNITQDDFTKTVLQYTLGIGSLSFGSGIVFKIIKWRLSR